METVHNGPYTNPVDWFFRSRSTGRITLVQAPNVPLLLFLVLVVVRIVVHPGGTPGMALTIASAIVLLAWAGLEVLRGVNPFRRLLGAVVALSQVLMLLTLR